MKLKDFFNLCVNDYIIYIYVSENQLVYKGLLDKFDKEDLKRRKELDPTVAIVAAALMQYISEQEAAAKATTVPEVGESLWKHYGKMQKIANRF